MANAGQIMYDLIYRIPSHAGMMGTFRPRWSNLPRVPGKPGKPLTWAAAPAPTPSILPVRALPWWEWIALPRPCGKPARKATRAGVKPEFILHDVTRLDFLRVRLISPWMWAACMGWAQPNGGVMPGN